MSKSIVLPAGRYYLGDPCYVFDNHNSWMILLESSNYLEDFVELNMRHGLRGEGWVAASNTQWGDGEYAATFHGARLGVDAGLIGVVHESVVKHHANPESIASIWDPEAGPAPSNGYSGVWVTFKEPFRFTQKDSQGTINAGHIEIYTGDDHEDEDEDYGDFEYGYEED